jgi:hypothetical protein
LSFSETILKSKQVTVERTGDWCQWCRWAMLGVSWMLRTTNDGKGQLIQL